MASRQQYLRLLKLGLVKSHHCLLQQEVAESLLKLKFVIESSYRHSLYHPMLLNVAEAMATALAVTPMGDSLNTT